jgi:hypothetical protein
MNIPVTLRKNYGHKNCIYFGGIFLHIVPGPFVLGLGATNVTVTEVNAPTLCLLTTYKTASFQFAMNSNDVTFINIDTQNTQFMFRNHFPEYRAVYEKMCKDMVQLDRPKVTT